MSAPSGAPDAGAPQGSDDAADEGQSAVAAPAYPLAWEADVLLADGGTAHLRPIRPDDADRLVEMHGRLSAQTIYYRFFGPYPRISPADLERFTVIDYHWRVAFVALLGERLVAVGRYEGRPGDTSAEVAFVVEDSQQGRGFGSVLLEHLAMAARERGIPRFEAEVLAQNRGMLRIFLDAGYSLTRSYDSGTVHVEFDVAPTATSDEVMRSREHRAEARSIGRLLHPRAIAVVGASRDPEAVGGVVLRVALAGGFAGPVYPVNPSAAAVGSVAAYARLQDIPGPVDLVVLCAPPGALLDVTEDCAAKGVHAMVVVTDPGDPELEQEVVRRARAFGMRVVGPACLGVLDTSTGLNASLVPRMPVPGRVGFFAQSGALGIALLQEVDRRGIGLSTFVSAGHRADVSGNDLLQYWEDDEATDVVLLYLESFGNPRKFARLARRVGRTKPVVAMTAGRQGFEQTLLASAGVVQVATVPELLDAATLLSTQPLPGGDRVGIVTNSDALARLAVDACRAHELEPVEVLTLPVDSGAEQYREALDQVCATCDAVVAVFVPPVKARTSEVGLAVAAAGGSAQRPVLATFTGVEGVVPELGPVPAFVSPEAAVAALARARGLARWRAKPAGAVPAVSGIDAEAGRAVIDDALTGAAEADGMTTLGDEPVVSLLGAYGIEVVSALPVQDADEAVAAAQQLGWPVVLKTTSPAYRHRQDLGGVRLDLGDEPQLRSAWAAMTVGLGAAAQLVVQQMAPPGVAVVVGAVEDARVGPAVSFALGGIASDLIGDRAIRLLPLTDTDAAELVAAPRAAPLLSGYRGAAPVDTAAVQDLVLRVARLKDDLPEVAALELNPVVVSRKGLRVLAARVEVGAAGARLDTGPRRMSDAPAALSSFAGNDGKKATGG